MGRDWLKNKVCIVTGGASGIGEAIVRALANRGAIVVIADLNQARAQTIIEELTEQSRQGYFIKTDVTQALAVKAVVAQAKTYGPIQYLVNSAGLQTYGTAETTSEADWDLTMNVNLKSMFLVAKEVIPEVLKNGGGAIVNISSVQGMRSQKNVLAYATSKAGAIALTRCMGLDYAAKGIRVNCICPGSIDTPLLRFGAAQHGEEEEVLQEWGRNHPIGRIGTPNEIANLALYLMSPEASFIVGQSIVADGGLSSIIL
jgi:NAD(P)-dependent dehydrogenase (short-subunit alcohol dehydrogenase family)